MSYISNRDRERCALANTKVRKRNREFVLEDKKKRGGCARCPETHSACLDYHHKDRSEKFRDVSDMSNCSYSLETLKKELEKCVLLCANCHRKEENPT